MSIVYRLDGALLPFQSVRLQGNDGTENGFPGFAAMGEPGIASVRVEDPAGTLDIDGWHTFTVEETACSKPRIFSGWILGRTISRGPYRNSAGRIWDCEIIDQNALFSFEVFRSSAAGKRPAETDVARVQAAIASHAMAGTPIYDNGRLNTGNTTSLAAGNFIAQTPAEMFVSTATQAGKNFYAYWDDSAGQISMHYDLRGAGPAAGITISNVFADVTSGSGGTCYAPFMDAQLNSDPTPLATGVLLHWSGGYVYDRNSTLIDDLSPSEFSPVNFLRDATYDSDRIGKASSAAAVLQQQLDLRSAEAVEITCTVQVTAAHVNLAKEGDIITVRFSHLPGYTSATPVAIKSRQVEPVDGMDSLYNIHLVLSDFSTVRGPGGGGVGGLPLPNCLPARVQTIDGHDTAANVEGNGITLGATPTPGNLLIAWVLTRNVTTSSMSVTGFTATGSGFQDDPSASGKKTIGCRFFYRFVQSGDSAHIALTRDAGGSQEVYVHISEWSGVDQFDGLSTWTSQDQFSTDPFIYGSATITGQANRGNLFVTGYMPSLNVGDNWFPAAANIGAIFVAGSGVGGATSQEAKGAILSRIEPKTATPSAVNMILIDTPANGISRGYAALSVRFSGTCTDTPPDPGQPVNNEPPDSVGGGQTNFTTGTPYAEGSLKVYVDGTRQYVVETDPSTGAYALLFDPYPWEYVVTDYQARTGEG